MQAAYDDRIGTTGLAAVIFAALVAVLVYVVPIYRFAASMPQVRALISQYLYHVSFFSSHTRHIVFSDNFLLSTTCHPKNAVSPPYFFRRLFFCHLTIRDRPPQLLFSSSLVGFAASYAAPEANGGACRQLMNSAQLAAAGPTFQTPR
jgi:hypothetical protein